MIAPSITSVEYSEDYLRGLSVIVNPWGGFDESYERAVDYIMARRFAKDLLENPEDEIAIKGLSRLILKLNLTFTD